MLIFRYLTKEVFVTLAALTAILLLIFMSNQFVLYLNRAANGQIPLVIIMKLMMLEMPNLMSLLLPLGFYVALLVAYGRLYAESEMTVLQACGYGPSRLLKHSFVMASLVALLVAFIMLQLSPSIATERARLLRASGIQTLIQTIMPGRFQAVSGGKEVFYVEKMDRDRSRAKNIFLARQVIKNNIPQWDILFAEQAFAEIDPGTQEDYLILQQGSQYEGVPGHSEYQVAHFEQYKARLPHQKIEVKRDIRTAKTADLLPWLNSDTKKAAELQWRISIPLMVFTLTLVAVPLSRVNSRSGKFAKLLPALIIFILYANCMFIARDWIVVGKVPVWLGMWWLHMLVILIGLSLLWYNRVKLA